MVGTTVNYSLPYPADSSPVAVPQDIQALANAIDGKIVGKTGGTFTGSVTFNTVPPTCAIDPTLDPHLANKKYVDAVQTNVNAINTELGSDPSGTYSTVKARLDASAHPSSVQDEAIARFNGTSGPLQESSVKIDDNGLLTYPTTGGWILGPGVSNKWGMSTPNGSINADYGSTYLQSNATNDKKQYIRWIKTTTSSSNTGWIPDANADTGWRSVSHNWSGYLYIRRIGMQVIIRVVSMTGISQETLYTLPTGFRPPSQTNFIYENNMYININTSGVISSTDYTSIQSMNRQFMFITDEAYPSTLPGSAV